MHCPPQLASSFMALQVAAIFATYLCGLMTSSSLRQLMFAHVAATSTVAILMFGNRCGDLFSAYHTLQSGSSE